MKTQSKKHQKLIIKLLSKKKDFFGMWEVEVSINRKIYTYPIPSEFAVEQIERMLQKKRYSAAIMILKQFKTE